MRNNTPNDAGFTLIECVVVSAIIALLATSAVIVYRQALLPKARARSTLAAAFAQTEMLARNNGGSSSGAVLVIASSEHATLLTILRGRPIAGYLVPSIVAGLPPINIDQATLVGTGRLREASVAFSPSGHVDVIPQAIAAGAAPFAVAPGCGSGVNDVVPIALDYGESSDVFTLSCGNGSLSGPK